MCGFAGVINSAIDINKEMIAEVASHVKFRGPDHCGICVYNAAMQPADNGRHGVFFNRLAILDIDKRSNQPFEDERYCLTFNGEIYNFKQLRTELKKIGCTFKTSSDTEVLFYALQTWGKEALKRLNGMFAFCFIDKQEKRFLMARDRLGIKPLYYSVQQGSLIFGSELYSVVRLSPQPMRVNYEAVQMYLWMQSVPTPHTAVENVYKLPPGNCLSGNFVKGAVEVNQPVAFWEAYDHTIDPNTNEDHLPLLLKESLEKQLVADVPLGLFLSSGVDSSLLAAMVNRYFSKEQSFNFYTVAFNETTETDESDAAAAFIKAFNNPGLHCHRLNVDAEFLEKQLDNIYDYVDEPFGDTAILLNKAISEKARETVTVALSGDGADELFWGYNRYNLWKEQTLELKKGIAVKGMAAKLAALFSPTTHHRIMAQLVTEKDPVVRHFNLFVHPFFKKNVQKDIDRYRLWALNGIEKVGDRPDLPAVLDIKTYLADAMLYKVDRSSMAASLEVRVPYLDNDIVDYALSLALHKKSTDQFKNKHPLKSLLQQLAPHYNVHQKKKGFSFPLNKWLKGNWQNRVMDSMDKTVLAEVGLEEHYLKMVEQYFKGTDRNLLPISL